MKRKHANILIHHSPYYRMHTFAEGLKRHGYSIISDRNASPKKNDVLLIWNRSAPHETIAKRYEAAGATVIVTENGYVGKTKAIAKWHHAGAGEWYVGEDDRWSQLGVDVKPWRPGGDHILVLPQRGIGEPGVAMPRNWETTIIKRLQRVTNRPVRIRKHPGKNPTKPIEEDLKDAWASVVWASGAGVKSIIAGVPVFHDLHDWIGAPAASCVFDIENPYMGDRSEMLHRLSWAQWTWQEINDGVPFECLQ